MKRLFAPPTHCWWLLALHGFLAVAFSVITPVWEAPDEVGHYLYVRFLQAYHTLPVQGPIFDAPRAHHPPGYYFIGALVTAGVPIAEPPDQVSYEINTKFPFNYGEQSIDNKMAYIHYRPDERFPYSGQALAVHLIRAVSVVFSLLAVWFTYQAARYLRPGDDAFAFLATGLVAANPAYLFIAGMINNDSAGVATCAALFYALSRFSTEGWTWQKWVMVGAAWGVGMLLKTSVFLLVVPIGLVAFYEAWQTRAWKPAFRKLITAASSVGLTTFAIAGWWYVRNHLLYGDWTANKAIADFIGRVPEDERWALLPERLYSFATGLFGRFGIGHGIFFYPEQVYPAVGLLALFLLGSALWAAGEWKQPHLKQWRTPWAWVITPTEWLWVAHGVFTLAVMASVFVFMLTVNGGWIGRYLFPAYVSLGSALALGALRLFPQQRWVIAVGLPLLSFGFAAYASFGLMLPAYSPPRAPTAAELQQMTPLDANIGDTARLLGYRLETPTVQPGGMVAVTVYWEVLSQTDVPYTVFIHLYDPVYGSLAQRDTYPGLGNYPTRTWDPGRKFVDTYRIFLPPDVPVTENAQILLGLYNWPDDVRLPVTGANAGPEELRWAEFGRVSIQP